MQLRAEGSGWAWAWLLCLPDVTLLRLGFPPANRVSATPTTQVPEALAVVSGTSGSADNTAALSSTPLSVLGPQIFSSNMFSYFFSSLKILLQDIRILFFFG